MTLGQNVAISKDGNFAIIGNPDDTGKMLSLPMMVEVFVSMNGEFKKKEIKNNEKNTTT